MTAPISLFDQYFTLMGDEDTDVGVHCLECDTRGAPVIFYTVNERVTGYDNSSVKIVHSISDMLTLMRDHLHLVHSNTRRF